MGSQKPETNITTTSALQKLVTKPYGKIELSLNNVLLPEEKLVNTPSRTDGLDFETETDLRILGCELIQTAGILLRLPQVAMATGQVLFQRFYYSKSFVRCPMETTAMSCICLASKIEEAPRRIRDVINVFHHIRQVQAQRPITAMILDQHYITLKTQVIKAERRVLKELGFCVHVKHPHKIIVVFLQVLGFEQNTEFLQLSWNYMNDALRCDVFMKYDPEVVACACIYLSARRMGICLPRTPILWFSLFNAKERDLIEISRKIVRLYARPKRNVDELEKRVEELKKAYQEARLKTHGVISGANTPNSNSPMRNNNNNGNHAAAEKPRSESRSRSKSKSRSRSRSTSRTPTKSKRPKKSRGRSRTPDRRNSKKHRAKRSYSPSPSPNRNHSKRIRDKTRYRSRTRSPLETKTRSGSYDKYYSSEKKVKSKHRGETYEDTRIRSRH